MIDWSRMIENAAPAAVSTLVVSSLMVLLNHRANRGIERYKVELARQLAGERARLEESILRRSGWYEKRANALVELYGAFYAYLDFLRRNLYFDLEGRDVTPIYDFRRTCDSLSIFLTDELKVQVDQYAVELLQFWNWADRNRKTDLEAIRHRLDHEIPRYLDRLRIDISRYLDELPDACDNLTNTAIQRDAPPARR